ncbi:MAG TPA: DNA translocase FtsK 4TM domain-containing protein, partial [Myxococcota bacterium]|nr:DNA translocase FtsK 4TM domain-containing protein [Myxococcota bacterium]
MGSARRRSRDARPVHDRRRRWLREASGLLALASALIAGIALASYDPADAPFRLGPVRNAAGPLGATFASLLRSAFGVGAFVAVPALGLLGLRWLLGGRGLALPARFWAATGLLVAVLATLPVLLGGLAPARFDGSDGGDLGALLASLEGALLHAWGALALNVLLLAVACLGVLGIAPGAALAAAGAGAAATGRLAARGASSGGRRAALALHAAGGALHGGVEGTAIWWRRRARRARVAKLRPELSGEGEPAAQLEPPETARPGALAAETGRAPAARRRGAPDIVDHRRSKPAEPEQEEFTFAEAAGGGPYQLPDVEIFQRPPDGGRSYDRDSLIMNSRILEKKLQDFGVAGRVVTVHPGPVITMYEYEPAPGVKVNRITNLADDLALALRALSIRIIAPIPGKSVVGIEVPNPEREVVYIRDLLEAKSFRGHPSRLTLALGKDIFGHPVEADLAQMPHLLV